MEWGYDIALLLFAAALLAGWVDAIAGGGGFITAPALLLVGVPPAAALATNKLQSCFGSFTSAYYFIRCGIVTVKGNRRIIAGVLLGAIFGSWLVLQLDVRTLLLLLPGLLCLIGLYFLLSPRIGDKNSHQRLSHRCYALFIAPLVGFYDGFLGPGAGTFMIFSLVTLRGKNLVDATAHGRLMNFTSNIASLGYFLFFGDIVWAAGGVMIMGQLIGSYVGARMVLAHKGRFIRPMVVIMCFTMCAKLLMDQYASG